MKKILISISILLFLTYLLPAQSLMPTGESLATSVLIPSTHLETVGLTGSVYDKREVFKESKEQISVIDSIHSCAWDNELEEWYKYLRFFYSYDGNGNATQVSALYLLPENNEWVNYINYHYTLDEQGNRVEELNQGWDTASSSWVNTYKHLFAYDESGNLLEEVAYAWAVADNNWKESYKFMYTYDDAGNMLSQISYGWDIDQAYWKVSVKYTSTYNDDGQLMEKYFLVWNSTSEEWENNQQFIYTYNEEGLMSNYICFSWNNSVNNWVNLYKYEYAYGIEDVTTRYTWNADTENWVAITIINYSFNENGNLIGTLYKNWNTQLNEWVYSNRYDYFWSEIEGVEDKDVSEAVTIFPNPAKGTIYITGNNYIKSPVQFKIFNLNGQLVYSNTLNSLNTEFSITLPQLPADLYLLKIVGKDFIKVEKIIIQ
jgi:hypothetical protein